ncbi:hypothetical protein [Cyclobacterium xiamenense]|uniref:hypothetical protein n=1 Tax=Cyclobacterium xiamenense TaxID=1297121 RepID=UPI0035CFC7AB
MGRLLKNSRKLLASLGVVAFLMVAGWQFGLGGSKAVFSETEKALENAVAGSLVAYGCKYTGSFADECKYGSYLIYKCTAQTIMLPSTCEFLS